MINELELKNFLRNNLELTIEKTFHFSYTERIIQLKMCGEVISEVALPNETKTFDPYVSMEI